MNLGEIRTELDLIIQDDSYTDAQLNSYINESLVYAAGLVELPDLKRIDSIDTVTVPYVSLSGLTGGLSGRLKRVNRSSYGAITIYPSLDLLMDNYASSDYPAMTKAGSVEAVALEGSTLWYQYVPAAAETLTILYFQQPASLSLDADTPSDFPEHLHRKLFVNGSAHLIFDAIEDGIEGKKVNAASHFYHSFDESNRHSGIIKLKEWISRKRVNYKSSVWRY